MQKIESSFCILSQSFASDAGNFQVLFFQHIKTALPPYVSLIDDVAEQVAAFKSYSFKKSIIQYDQVHGVKFVLDGDYCAIFALAKKIANAFSRIPGTQIWHEENSTSTLRQVEFYKLTGNIKSASDAFCVLDKVEERLNHMEMQAETGKKFNDGASSNGSSPEHTMYINEIIWGDNMIHVEMGKTSITYINRSILNFITTHDKMFSVCMKKLLTIMAAKSTQISSANKKAMLFLLP